MKELTRPAMQTEEDDEMTDEMIDKELTEILALFLPRDKH